jgi:hypothetical protein
VVGPKHLEEQGRHNSSGHSWWWPLPALLLAGLAVLGVTGANGGLTAKVTNSGDRAQTGSAVTMAASGGSPECDLSGAPIGASNTATCSGTLVTSGTLPTTGSSPPVSTTITEKGSLAGTAAGLTEGACGPVELADSAAISTDPMLVRGTTLAYAQAGPTSLAGSSGLGLNGTSGYASDIAGLPGPATTNFTELVWFKASVGGTLVGFSNTPTTSPGMWDKMLWVDNTGHVVFGVYPGHTVWLTSTSTYFDGGWHLAVGTLNTSSGLSLFVDGAAAVTDPTTTAQAYNGYWHVGWDNEVNGWTDPPTNPYFTGTLADAAIFPTALTKTQINTLRTAGTQIAWAADVTNLSATSFWALGDNGTTPYTGTVPNVTPAACSFVDATVGAAGVTATCAAPARPSSCSTPSSSVTLASLANKTTPFAVYPNPAQSVIVTITIARDAATTTAAFPDATGLHLTASMSVAVSAGTFSATLAWPTENVIL